MTAREILSAIAELTGSNIADTLYACRDFEPGNVLAILASDLAISLSFVAIGLLFVGYVTLAMLRGHSPDEIRRLLARAVPPPVMVMIGLTLVCAGLMLFVHSLTVLFGPNDAAEAAARAPTAFVALVTAVLVGGSFWRAVRSG